MKQKPDLKELYAVKLKAVWNGMTSEHIAFWALCVYFLTEYVRPQSIYPALEIVPWAKLSILLTLATVFVDGSVKWVSNIENKLMFCFLLIIVLSGFFAFRPISAWNEIEIFLNWFLIYFLVINIVNTEKRLVLFLLVYFLANLKMAQHGFFQLAARGFAFEEWGLVGPPGWFGNSGEYAIQMLIFAALSGAFVLGLRHYWGGLKKGFLYFLPISAVFCVIGASTRGAQLALLVMGAWFLLKTRSGLKALIAGIVLMVVFFQFLPEEQMGRFESMGKDETSLQRLLLWKAGLSFMKENPFLGVGYANWRDYYAYARPDDFASGLASEVHNIFIEAGAELGYTGLLCFLLMILYMLILNARTRRIARTHDNDFLYFTAHGLDAGLIGYLVAGFFVTVLYYPFFWVQLAMTVALYNVTAKLVTDSDSKIIRNHHSI